MREYQKNKKANFDYSIEKTLEVGIVLHGWERKAILSKQCKLEGAFVKIKDNEAFIYGFSVYPLYNTHPDIKADENRVKKLLLHKKEIAFLDEKARIEGNSIIPLNIYAIENSKLKLTIGVAKGKKQYDKRKDLKVKDIELSNKRENKAYRIKGM